MSLAPPENVTLILIEYFFFKKLKILAKLVPAFTQNGWNHLYTAKTKIEQISSSLISLFLKINQTNSRLRSTVFECYPVRIRVVNTSRYLFFWKIQCIHRDISAGLLAPLIYLAIEYCTLVLFP